MVAEMSTSSDRYLKKVSHAHYGGGVDNHGGGVDNHGGGVDNPNMGLIAQRTVWLIGPSGIVLYSVGADYVGIGNYYIKSYITSFICLL